MDVRPNALFCLGQNAPNGIALFHMPCLTERAWTKKECSDALNATEEMLDSVQIYAGMVIVRKSASSMRFVEEWLRHTASDLVTENMQMAIQHSTVVQHRHDQSILSILSKRHLLKSYPFPTRAHDVRDVWAWDAGYCSPEGFDWPLPFFRSHLFFGFVTHYKEFGHQRDSARMCHKVQGPSAPVPLTDYLESKRTFNEMLRDEQLAKDMQKRKITGRSLRNGTSGDRCLSSCLCRSQRSKQSSWRESAAAKVEVESASLGGASRIRPMADLCTRRRRIAALAGPSRTCGSTMDAAASSAARALT